MESIRTKIGAELRAIRQARGLSIRELAERTGIGYAHISRVENGTYNIRLDIIERLLAGLNAELKIEARSE